MNEFICRGVAVIYVFSIGPRGPMRILYIEVLVYSHIVLWVPRGACGLWVPGGAYGLWVPRCADEQQFESRELFMERRKLFSRFRRCELLGSEMDILAFDILHSDV